MKIHAIETETVAIARDFVEKLRSTSSNPVIYAAMIDGIGDFAAWVRSMRVRSRVESPRQGPVHAPHREQGAKGPAAVNVQAF